MSTENVRGALAAVEGGNVDAGIVYKTDALISKKVKVAVEIPAAEGPKISYPVAVTKTSSQPERAKKFVEYLRAPACSNAVREIWIHRGRVERTIVTAETWQIVFFTIEVSALSTLLILPFGIAIAWLIARRNWPGKAVVETRSDVATVCSTSRHRLRAVDVIWATRTARLNSATRRRD